MFSSRNPFLQAVGPMAEAAREQRKPVPPDNPFLMLEGMTSKWIGASLDSWRVARDSMTETAFLATYGSPLLRAAVGLGQKEATAGPRVEQDLVREADQARLRSELEQRYEVGDPVEAALRALCYVNQPEGNFDERQFAVLKRFQAAQPLRERRSFAELKELLREQSLLMRLDGERAVAAIPKLLQNAPDKSRACLQALHKVLDARDDLSEEGQRRLHVIDGLFEPRPGAPGQPDPSHA
jgi:hypothetical protein